MKVIKPNTLELLECSVAESDDVDGVAWDETTTYSQGQKVRYEHVSYESLADSNKGNIPSETWSGTSAKWKRLGATLPWRMLDDFVETQTVGQEGESLTFTVPFSRATAFGLLNLTGATVHVTVTDDDEGVFFDKTYSIVKDIDDFSLYSYNFDEIQSVDTLLATGIPMPISGTLAVEIDPGSGATASVGHVIVGRDRSLGGTLYDAEVSITDYSRKEADEFGVTTFVRRSYAKRASLELYLHPRQSDFVAATLQDLRATPAVWIGDNTDSGYTALTIFGWVEDWRSVYSGPNEQQLSVDVQGLI